MKTASNGHDPYQVLGVGKDASADEIKRAYRRLARQYHPDTTGGDKAKERRFKEISAAYDVLGDPKKRAQYDAMRSGRVPPGFGGEAGGAFDFGELFEQFFGGRAGRGAGPGDPAQSFHYRVYDAGGESSGSGGSPFESFGGLGDLFADGRFKRRKKRPTEGRARERQVRASDGSLLSQRGLDVYSEVRIAIDQAILGAVVEVPTLSGKASVRIPPGTSSGTRLRLRGKGARGAGGRSGSHYLTVQIDVPKKLDDDAKKLLVEFMQKVK